MRATDVHGRPVELTKIAGEDCDEDDCAAVSLTDRGTAAVQGYTLHADTPAGEGVLELPVEVLLEAARALRR
ncbi:MAG: hypothetical protein ACR2GE_02185 [Pseudonocardia sp.]